AEPIDDDLRRATWQHLGQLREPTDQALQTERIGAAYRDDVIRVGECCQRGAVAPRRGRVVTEFFVLLKAKAAVDNRQRRQLTRNRQDAGQGGRAKFGPSLDT